MTTPDELAELLESEDMETEVVKVAGAIVIDSDYKEDFFNGLKLLFETFVYLDDNYELNVEESTGEMGIVSLKDLKN